LQNIKIFRSLFSTNTNSKKYIIFATALVKKTNLFKKYDNYKRTLFYRMHKIIKNRQFKLIRYKKNKFFVNKNNFFDIDFLDKQHNSFKNFYSKSTNVKFTKKAAFYNNNLSFFKKIKTIKKYSKISFRKFFKKKRLFYRMNRRFNKRFYANRLIFKHVYLKEKNRQFSITNFIENFKVSKRYNFYKQTQMFLFIVLLSSQFFLFKADCIYFLKKYGVFVNGKLCTNPYLIITAGDVIQIPIISTYYVFFKKYKNIYSVYLKKYVSKFARITSSKKKKFRTRSRFIPN
jgi:hypothetical protein